jgi:hypothetical protein
MQVAIGMQVAADYVSTPEWAPLSCSATRGGAEVAVSSDEAGVFVVSWNAKFARSQSTTLTIKVAIAASKAVPPQLKGNPRKPRKNSIRPVKYTILIIAPRSTAASPVFLPGIG